MQITTPVVKALKHIEVPITDISEIKHVKLYDGTEYFDHFDDHDSIIGNVDLFYKDEELFGTIKVLKTEQGDTFRDLVASKVNMNFILVGSGKVNDKGEIYDYKYSHVTATFSGYGE